MKNNKVEIKIVDYIDDQHRSHYWYGGQCAVIKYKGYTFSIEAIGDVYWTYLDDGSESECFKDKNNGGIFYGEMSWRFKNDDELYEAIDKGELTFDNNNWWECFVYDKDGEFHDLMWDLDASYLDEAIQEVEANLDNMIAYIEEED